MPDTMTPNYGLTVVEVGTSSDSWGTKNNTNLTLIDAALKVIADLAAAALPASGYTAADILTKIKTVDGAASGLDAQFLAGQPLAALLLASAYTAADVMAKVKSVDGAGSGLDADLLDGQHAAAFAAADHTHPGVTLDPLLQAIAALTTADNQVIYTTGSDAVAMTALTALGRSLIGAANAAAALGVLGTFGGVEVSATNPGHIKFSFSGSSFMICFGTFTASANGSTAVAYSAQSSTTSFPVASGTGELSASAQDNGIAVISANEAGFTVYNASNSCTGFYLAVGY